MKLKCNIDLATLEPEDEFTITNSDGDSLECALLEDDEDTVCIMFDLFIGGDIDDLGEQVASIAREASFMEQLRDSLKAAGQEIVTDTDSENAAGEDPYLILYMDLDFLKSLIDKE